MISSPATIAMAAVLAEYFDKAQGDSMSNAARQKRYRDSKRNAQPEQDVTKSPKRNAQADDAERNARGAEAMHQLLQIPDGKWTSLGPEDDSQSTNSGAVVAEHPPRTKGTCIHCGRGPLGDITHYPDGSAICDKCKTEQRTRTVPIPTMPTPAQYLQRLRDVRTATGAPL